MGKNCFWNFIIFPIIQFQLNFSRIRSIARCWTCIWCNFRWIWLKSDNSIDIHWDWFVSRFNSIRLWCIPKFTITTKAIVAIERIACTCRRDVLTMDKIRKNNAGWCCLLTFSRCIYSKHCCLSWTSSTARSKLNGFLASKNNFSIIVFFYNIFSYWMVNKHYLSYLLLWAEDIEIK